MKFTKMHGIGNDYIYVNCFEELIDNPAQLAPILSARHTGIGGDGLILICPSDQAQAKMRMFNADGSEAEMCGNGLRCVAKYVADHGLAEPGGAFSVPVQQACPRSLNIETGNGVLKVGLIAGENGKVEQVCVNMGQPILNPSEIPVNLSGDDVIDLPIEVLGRQYNMTAVSMGNPHAVFFCSSLEETAIGEIGPEVENHELFPNRTNVNFVQRLAPDEFKMVTWERGSGLTMACGTGGCASAVAAVLTGRCERTSTGHLPGGDLRLTWSEDDNCVYMTGAATEVFHGEIEI